MDNMNSHAAGFVWENFLIHHSKIVGFLQHLVLTWKPGYPKEIKISELACKINIIENLHHSRIVGFWSGLKIKESWSDH